MYQCPECGQTREFDVAVIGIATVIYEDDKEKSLEVMDHSVEWTEDDMMTCGDCGLYEGAGAFAEAFNKATTKEG